MHFSKGSLILKLYYGPLDVSVFKRLVPCGSSGGCGRLVASEQHSEIIDRRTSSKRMIIKAGMRETSKNALTRNHYACIHFEEGHS